MNGKEHFISRDRSKKYVSLWADKDEQCYVDTLHLYQHFTDQPIEEYILETTPEE